MYDPVSGRFLQEDPLGLSPGRPNPFLYAADAPTLYTDPSGLKITLDASGAVAGGAALDGLWGGSSAWQGAGPSDLGCRPGDHPNGVPPDLLPFNPNSLPPGAGFQLIGGPPGSLPSQPQQPSGGSVDPVFEAALDRYRQLLQRLPANNLPPDVVNAIN